MQLLAASGIAGYLISAIALLFIFFKQRNIALLHALIPGLVALAVHVNFIIFKFDLADAHSYNLLLVVNLISVIISSIALAFAQKFHNFFVLPVCFFIAALILSSDLFIPNDIATLVSWTPEMMSHISLALLAYALLIIATLLTFQYSFISHKLKMHDLSVLTLPIPALNLIEAQIFKILVLGYVCLSISIITGLIFLTDFFGSGQAHKSVLSILAWLCYSILLFGHYRLGWRGNIVLIISTLGASLLTLGYFGSRFIREIILN